MNATAQGKVVDSIDAFDNAQRAMTVRIMDQRTAAGLDGIHYSELSLLLCHSPNPFIRVTFMLISDVGSLPISRQSTESTPRLAPVLSGAQPKIQLCQASLNGFRQLRERYYSNILITLTHT